MGYSTTFRLKGELDEQFKGWGKTYTDLELEEYKSLIMAVCLTAADNYSSGSFLYSRLRKIYVEVASAVRTYIHCLENNWKLSLTQELKDNNNQIDVYGWNYSENNSSDWPDAYVSYFVNNLFEVAIFNTESPFDSKHNKFDEKKQQIWDYVRDIEEEVRDNMMRKFVNFYRDHPELADESDGCTHFFPEEEKEDTEESAETTDHVMQIPTENVAS